MKKVLKAGILSVVLASSLVYAADDQSYSLIGIEGGAGNFDTTGSFAGVSAKSTKNPAEYGFKIGAQSNEYRLFLSARGYELSALKNTYSLGGELQYLLNVSEYANVFMGFNVGSMHLEDNYVNAERTYYGGDLGVNIHIVDSFDLEIGGRYMHLGFNETGTVGGVTENVKIDHMVTGYASLIYRFHMDN